VPPAILATSEIKLPSNAALVQLGPGAHSAPLAVKHALRIQPPYKQQHTNTLTNSRLAFRQIAVAIAVEMDGDSLARTWILALVTVC